MKKLLEDYPAIPYIAPFALFLLVLGLKGVLPFGPKWTYVIQVVLVSTLILIVARREIAWTSRRPASAVLVGLLVFVVWIGPDLLWAGYRQHWLFENSLMGKAESSLPVDLRTDMMFLIFRMIGTAIVVPIVEELFWRGWLMRYLVNSEFTKVPLGTYSALAMWVSAALFATEHGPYWEVGLLAGLIYNWWMLRTRNLTDCMIAHGVTNAALGAYVMYGGRWEYWL